MAKLQKERKRQYHIIGIAGSLRKGSYNRMLLKAAKDLSPAEMEIEIFEIEGIPPFNADFEKTPPDIVKTLKEKIKESDGILLVTPEYNYSISGVLKNAIDAVSRPYGTNPFEEKPVAIMGASTGMIGTARAQYHLRQMMVFLNAYPLNRPEVMVPNAEDKFDREGKLSDEFTSAKIKELLASFEKWIRKLQGG